MHLCTLLMHPYAMHPCAHAPHPCAHAPMQDNKIRSRYEEDVHPGNHSSVWGSWWHDSQWGFSCCHQTVKNSYCTGKAGETVSKGGLGLGEDWATAAAACPAGYTLDRPCIISLSYVLLPGLVCVTAFHNPAMCIPTAVFTCAHAGRGRSRGADDCQC